MIRAVRAGAAYFVIVFAAGFLLGTLRVFFVAPALGDIRAVLFELPLMLSLSWFACGWCIRRWSVEPLVGARLGMGAVALTLLLAAEFLLGLTAFDRGAGEQLQATVTGAGLIGLAGQLGAAAFPLLAGRGQGAWHLRRHRVGEPGLTQ